VNKRDSNELSGIEFDLDQVTTSSNQNRSKLECWLAWICQKKIQKQWIKTVPCLHLSNKKPLLRVAFQKLVDK
jgi:hypothetical protein